TLTALAEWVRGKGEPALAEQVLAYGNHPAINAFAELDGPVGERNTYATRPKVAVLVCADSLAGLAHGLTAGLAAGNRVLVRRTDRLDLSGMPEEIAQRVEIVQDVGPGVQAVLVEGDAEAVAGISQAVAAWDGPIVIVQGATGERLAKGEAVFAIDLLVDEVSTSVNTTAAGGNASLMALV